MHIIRLMFVKAGMFEFWFCIRTMGKGRSTLN